MLRSMKSRLSGVSTKQKPADPPGQPGRPATSVPSTSGRSAGQQSSGDERVAGSGSSSGSGRVGPPALTHEELQRAYAEPLPSFREVHVSDRQALMVHKLHLCSFTAYVREKEMKRQTLLELVDYVNAGGGKFTEQIVYEFLLRFVVSGDTDAKVAKRWIDQNFVVKLLDLFDSEDPRERDYLKTILHRIYGKFMVHRPFIRKAINYVFYRFVFETERHNGIAELLEILADLARAPPTLHLQEEHKSFLTRALMPLHKPKCLPQYHQQLSYCVTQFVEKDPRLSEVVVRGLLRFWPLTNSHKEVLFLGELEEVLELTQAEEFSRVMEPLFKQISRCLTSSHFQVAERSLFLWNNEYIVQLVAAHRGAVLPLVIGALEHNAQHHWNPAVHGLTLNVRKMFQEMDSGLYEDCRLRWEEGQKQREAELEKRQRQWQAIESAALASSLPLNGMVVDDD
eukprot:scaffold9.g3032.t1